MHAWNTPVVTATHDTEPMRVAIAALLRIVDPRVAVEAARME
jgi:hypothetical protein